ncbi:hypothetical protein XNA1_2690007 [Xenorhabdus nematophila str. Anatoliense]|nr:hypothetical protein XNA1_1540007 [Xenorhabdus nematophila str. Anatoliense]CEE92179.1 hypothetical protein XNA1_2690007 [Xenorhabdus nematophila str. Anatoliense]
MTSKSIRFILNATYSVWEYVKLRKEDNIDLNQKFEIILDWYTHKL